MVDTQIQSYIDSARATELVPSSNSDVMRGGSIIVTGWALDPIGRQAPSAVYALLEDGRRIPAVPAVRNDVQQHFDFPEAARAGFTLTVNTNDLTFGNHAVQFIVEFGDDLRHEIHTPMAFRVVPPIELPRTNIPRILLACAPKTGSTFTARFLLEYLNINTPDIGAVDGATEHLLTDELLQRLGTSPCVLQYHVLPRPQHLRCIRQYALTTVVLWRNLADVIVSHDDEMNHAWYGPGPGFGYLRDPQQYLSMTQQRRYQFYIRHLAPWYIGFFLGWRDVTAPVLMHYELLAEDKETFFTQILRSSGLHVDQTRLRGLVEKQFAKTRFSAGVNGRAADKFSDETKQVLEDMLLTHPEDLTPLIEELPWRKGASAALDADPTAFSAEKNPMRRAPMWEAFDTRS
jgi:hypothetical protein